MVDSETLSIVLLTAGGVLGVVSGVLSICRKNRLAVISVAASVACCLSAGFVICCGSRPPSAEVARTRARVSSVRNNDVKIEKFRSGEIQGSPAAGKNVL